MIFRMNRIDSLKGVNIFSHALRQAQDRQRRRERREKMNDASVKTIWFAAKEN